MKTDVLIIGAGAAGLAVAAYLQDFLPGIQTILVAKGDDDSSSSQKAQGGLAAVVNKKKDHFRTHIKDTIAAGGGLCKRNAVRTLVEASPRCINDLNNWGAHFDRDKNGVLHLSLEGGHSAPRIVHHRDQTGKEIMLTLRRKVNGARGLEQLQRHLAWKLNTTGENGVIKCLGATLVDLNTGKAFDVTARITILATGGCGQLFMHTTNPQAATGDGVALAYKVGAKICNMQYVQFHPTAFFETKKNPLFLITEAVRGKGAYLCNEQGERFMPRYDSRAELATRDVVSNAIFSEMTQHRADCVFLDCRHFLVGEFVRSFPNIHQYLLSKGINTEKDLIPVVPAAHYQCGGIEVDEACKSSVERLYAIGECACSGVHGKNRLASNSLPEALVFARIAAQNITRNFLSDETPEISGPQASISIEQGDNHRVDALKLTLKVALTEVLLRSRQKESAREVCAEALNFCAACEMQSVPVIELCNMATTGLLILANFDE